MMQGIRSTGKPESIDGQLSGYMTLIFAVAAGLSVANVYCAQPLLGSIARDLGISSAAIGLVVTLTQIGYGLGLIFLVPLGDLMDRRRLILVQGILSVLALVAIATAQTEVLLYIGFLAMGLFAVMAQTLVAFAARLASPAKRGRVVGRVTSGIVTGILVARILAGVLADWGGWRVVYLTSALLMTMMVGVLVRILPRHLIPESSEGYVETLRSTPMLFLRDRVLLVRGLLAFLIFAAFSTFWTSLALPLGSAPFSYSHTQIGLFGLVGLAGVVAATGAGQFADRGLGQWVTGSSLVLLILSWGLLAFLPVSILLLTFGVILMDLAIQAVHVTSQSIIFGRHPNAGSRLVGGYMAFYSAGSAVGAVFATVVYAHVGWYGVSVQGATFSVIAFLVWSVPVVRRSEKI